jgi:hypothetical protein
VSRQFVQGPGSLRVGRFIGRLGVVSLPAVQAGLDLDQRVVRRHVAKLEAAGWLARTPWVWGEVKRSKTPGAVIAESGGRREDRQKMILEGWRDAIWSGRYLGVRYDCASPSVARWINRLAKKVGLTDSDFTAAVLIDRCGSDATSDASACWSGGQAASGRVSVLASSRRSPRPNPD